MPGENSLSSVEHVVVLMLENRSFDHMLGFLYSDSGNVSPAGQPYEGLTGSESNPAPSGPPFAVFKIEPARRPRSAAQRRPVGHAQRPSAAP
jgi:phospholipase C